MQKELVTIYALLLLTDALLLQSTTLEQNNIFEFRAELLEWEYSILL